MKGFNTKILVLVLTLITVASAGVHFLVVPRVATVARLELPSSHRYQPGGVALASEAGESREIAGVRPYRSGDPVRDLHVRIWARVRGPRRRSSLVEM